MIKTEAKDLKPGKLYKKSSSYTGTGWIWANANDKDTSADSKLGELDEWSLFMFLSHEHNKQSHYIKILWEGKIGYLCLHQNSHRYTWFLEL